MKVVSLMLGALAAITAHAQSPLPGDSEAGSSGTWHPTKTWPLFAGAWKGGQAVATDLPSAVVVEQVNSNGTAQVSYSWGDSAAAGFKAGWARLPGTISADRLHLIASSGTTIDFGWEPNGNLAGQYVSKGMPAFVEMERIPSSDPAVIIASAQATNSTCEREIRITEHSQVGSDRGKDPHAPNDHLPRWIRRGETSGGHLQSRLDGSRSHPGKLCLSRRQRGTVVSFTRLHRGRSHAKRPGQLGRPQRGRRQLDSHGNRPGLRRGRPAHRD